jgi:AcrR family transcriptional regulator
MVYTNAVDDKLPASIEAAWGRPPARGRGPKPGLSLERIVAAAVGLAAREGIGAVSMSRVAAELGSSPMSLYRYVAAKDELLALMVDAAMGSPPAAAQHEGWRAGMERWAWAYHDILRRHPWVLRIPLAAPGVTPNLTGWLEDGLRALAATGLPEEDKLSTLLLVSGFVRNEATLAADMSGQTEIMPAWARVLRGLTDDERFPALRAALASGAFEHDDDPDDEFVWGLQRILDGIAVLIDDPARAARRRR